MSGSENNIKIFVQGGEDGKKESVRISRVTELLAKALDKNTEKNLRESTLSSVCKLFHKEVASVLNQLPEQTQVKLLNMPMQLTPPTTICSIHQYEYLSRGCAGTNGHVSKRRILFRISEYNTLA